MSLEDTISAHASSLVFNKSRTLDALLLCLALGINCLGADIADTVWLNRTWPESLLELSAVVTSLGLVSGLKSTANWFQSRQ